MKIQLSDLNESIRKIPLPQNMLDRPVSEKGYPVPFFAAKNAEGEWDFRLVHPETTIKCVRQHLCWICGKTMGTKKAFVVGPMCVVTHTSAEPPSHYTCAQYSAIACPFLNMPRMKRNEKNLPEHHNSPAGIAIMRNPGCSAVLITNTYKPFNDGSGGMLIEMGKPIGVEWYAKHERATYTDVMESIASGVGLLYEQCELEASIADKTAAYHELRDRVEQTLALVPARRAGEQAIALPPPPL